MKTEYHKIFDSEVRKYIIRFGLLLAIIIPIVYRFGYGPTAKILVYKTCQISIGYLLGEALWLIFFKPYFGRTEDLSDAKILPVLLFRGILDGAIILAFCLGL